MLLVSRLLAPLAALGLLFLASPVLAASSKASTVRCPWAKAAKAGKLDVSASGHVVVVNSVAYEVKTRAERESFTAVLDACGDDDASRNLRMWRMFKTVTPYSMAAEGLVAWFLFWPALVAIPASPIATTVYRNQMVKAIEEKR